MNIVKQNDHYLLSNDYGEYHFSKEEYESLGESEAIKKAAIEIKKKTKTKYFNKTINFDQARELGFCEYGIKDFCTRLELNIESEYSTKDLKEKLTVELLAEYPSECLKLFGKDVIDKFGGVVSLLSDYKGNSNIFYFIIDNYIEDDILHKFSVKAAYYSLKNFENEFPNDNRPRLAIEAKEKYIKGEITEEELSAAESVSWSARSVARSAWSVCSAAELAAGSAAWSARSACSAAGAAALSARSTESAWSAARLAAASVCSAARPTTASLTRSAAYTYFSEELIKLLKE